MFCLWEINPQTLLPVSNFYLYFVFHDFNFLHYIGFPPPLCIPNDIEYTYLPFRIVTKWSVTCSTFFQILELYHLIPDWKCTYICSSRCVRVLQLWFFFPAWPKRSTQYYFTAKTVFYSSMINSTFPSPSKHYQIYAPSDFSKMAAIDSISHIILFLRNCNLNMFQAHLNDFEWQTTVKIQW